MPEGKQKISAPKLTFLSGNLKFIVFSHYKSQIVIYSCNVVWSAEVGQAMRQLIGTRI